MNPAPLNSDRLLRELPSLRALARHLVRDPHEADDIVQDTVVTALSTDARARDASHCRAWMAAILRNVVHQRTRARTRREKHESRLPVGDPATSAADAAAELAVHRQLVGCVEQLDEPLRHALFLHYWRGLTPREIAEQTDVPLKTVYGRLVRARLQIRARLDASHDTRNSWRAALTPLLGVGPTRATTTTRPLVAILMNSRSVVAAGACLLSLVLFGWFAAPYIDGGDNPGERVADRLAPLTSDRNEAVANDSQPLRTQGIAVEAQTGLPESAVPMLVGRVRTLDSRPVSGVRVACLESDNGGTQPERTDADGRFTLPHPGVETLATVLDDDWAAVCKAFVPAQATGLEPLLVVVAPRRDYAGVVVGGDGHPVANASVVVGIDGELCPARAIDEQTVVLPHDLTSTTTDQFGMFRLTGVGYLKGAQLEVEHPQWQQTTLPLPRHGTHYLRVRLSAHESGPRIYGIVADSYGTRVAGATIAAGQRSVRSFGEGRFALPVRRIGRTLVLRAVHPKHGVAVQELGTTADGVGSSPDRPIELRLAKTRTITGRVTDPSGDPVAGARVWTPDVTYLGDVTREEHGHLISGGTTLEAIASGQSARGHVRTLSKDDGTFVLSGLFERDYQLFAMHPSSLATTGPVRVTAGTAIELSLDSTGARRVAGRIVDRTGAPIAGVLVSPVRYLDWKRPKRSLDTWAGALTGRRTGTSSRSIRTTTDENGNFLFEALTTEQTYLWCSSQLVYTKTAFQLPSKGVDDLEIVLATRCSFAVHLRDPNEADDFFVERNGEDLRLTIRVESYEIATTYVEFARGISPVIYTATGDVTLVLRKKGKEIRRVKVTLPRSSRHVVKL